MIRLLMATTALAAVLATSAYAQDASSSSAMDSSMAPSSMESSAAPSSSMMDSSAMSSQMSTASSMDSSMMSSSAAADTTSATSARSPVDILSGYTTVDTDRLATKIIGQPVYDGTGTDANNLGKISDLVLDENGQVAAVVVGVGGFLGIGEKQVAVDFSALQFQIAADNTERYVLQTTKDQLTQAPDFKTVDDNPANPSGASTTPAPAESSASTDMMASSSAAQ